MCKIALNSHEIFRMESGVAVQLGSQCIFTRKPRQPRVSWLACEVTLDQLSLQAELP